MLLRWLVGNYLRESAETAVQEAMRQAARVIQHAGDAPPKIPEHYRIAFLFAQSIESNGFVRKLKEPAAARFGATIEHWAPLDDRPIRIVETGTGSEKARAGALECIARNRPEWVVAAGFASALTEHVHRGHIVIADSVIDGQGKSFRVGLSIDRNIVEATPYLHVGPIISIDHVLSKTAERQQLGQTTGALACDMESLAIAEVCEQERVRFLSVRIVTDAMDDELPPEVEHLLRQKSLAGKLGVAAGAVFQRPASIKSLWHKREEAQQASQRLASFLRGVLAQLS